MDIAKYHSIKKFELIEKYVKAWAEILMLNKQCRTLVFIDCMSNRGEYENAEIKGTTIMGTPVRVSKALKEVFIKHLWIRKKEKISFITIMELRLSVIR